MEKQKETTSPDALSTAPQGGFDNVSNFREGFAAVEIDGRYYFIDKKGENAFPLLKFEQMSNFNEGWAIVRIDGIICCINKSGELHYAKHELENIKDFHEGIAFARYKGSEAWVAIDKDFNEIFSLGEYVPYSDFHEGYAIVRRTKKESSEDSIWYYQAFPDKGNVLVDGQEEMEAQRAFEDNPDEYLDEFEGMVNEESQEERPIEYEYNFIDKTGKLLLPKWCLGARDFTEGFAVVRIDSRAMDCDITQRYEYNYINREGELLLGDNIYYAESFSEGLGAIAMQDDDGGLSFSCCYANTKGELVMPQKLKFMPGSRPDREGHRYSSASSFSEGVACIGWKYLNGMDGELIDHEGNCIYSFNRECESLISGFKEGLAIFAENESIKPIKYRRVYYIDKSGKEMFVDKHFDDACPFSEGMAVVKIDGKYHYIDKDGNFLHVNLY